MLGVIVAGGMIVLVLTALGQLAVRTGKVTRLTKDRLIATYLAREGIELVRAVRDNNWLSTPRCPAPNPADLSTYVCTIPWRGQSGAPGPGSLCTAGGRQVYRVDADTVTSGGLVLTTEGANDTSLFRFGSAYRHGGGGQATPFRRYIILESLDDPGCTLSQASVYVLPTPTPTPPPTPTPVPTPFPTPFHPRPITVTVVVQWTEEGVPREMRMTELLYSWMNYR